MTNVIILLGGLSHTVLAEKLYTSYSPLNLQANVPVQCSESDQYVWKDSQSFFSSVQDCTKKGSGSSDLTASVSQCLSTTYPNLSQNCAKCFGEDVDCGATNCRGACQHGDSQSCQTCLKPCTAAHAKCTGIANLQTNTTSTTTKNGVMSVVVGHVLFVGVMLML